MCRTPIRSPLDQARTGTRHLVFESRSIALARLGQRMPRAFHLMAIRCEQSHSIIYDWASALCQVVKNLSSAEGCVGSRRTLH